MNSKVPKWIDPDVFFKVVVNHEEQYSIWPAERENAVGWRDIGKTGTKAECLAYIKEVWTDMRPLSLRQRTEDSNHKSAIADERLLEPGADDKFSWHAAEVPVEESAAGRDETMSTTYIGEISLFGGNFAPIGWAFCNGQLLPILENEELFGLIGTTYGGDGKTTFALPDLQGRFPIHKGNELSLGQKGAPDFGGESDVDTPTESGYLAVNFIISLFGVLPSQDGHTQTGTFLAEGRIFAFDFAPGGWASCNGQLLPISQNQVLFSLLGTTYGGNGQTNFALPDLRRSIPIHVGSDMFEQQLSRGDSARPLEVTTNFLALNFCIALQGIYPSED